MNDVRHIVTVDFEKERDIDCTTGDQIVVVTFPSGLEPSLPTGVTTAMTSTRFASDRAVTRSEAATFLGRRNGCE